MNKSNDNKKIFSEINGVDFNILVHLSILCGLLFFHPYLILLYSTILNFYIRLNFIFQSLLFSVFIAAFLSSRSLGVTWSSGGDDLQSWLAVFNNEVYNGIGELFHLASSLVTLKNNEPIFYIFTLILSKIGISNFIYVYLNYFLLIFLIFYAALITSRRYYVYYVFLLFFGFGSFAEGPLLHLWRQTYASLLGYIAIVHFWSKPKVVIMLLFISILTHLASLYYLIFNILYKIFTRFLKNNILLRLILFVITCLLFLYLQNSISYVIVGVDFTQGYRGEDTIIGRGALIILTLCILYYYLNHSGLNEKEFFILSMVLLMSFMQLIIPDASALVQRYNTFFTPLLTFILFQILIKLPRIVNSLIVMPMFAMKITLHLNDVMIQAMFTSYFSIFQGVFLLYNSKY